MKRVMRVLADYFQGFDERARGKAPSPDEQRRDDASCGLCFAALLGSLGYMLSAASASAAAPF